MSAPPPAPSGWVLESVSATPAELHASATDLLAGSVGPFRGRVVRVATATRAAVVLGAAQPQSHVEAARAARRGLQVVRRRSGGSAVLVGPGESVWVDLAVGRADPLWHDDVGLAAAWVGQAWAAAITDLGGAAVRVWAGPMVQSRWSSRVCFAGLGPGEVVAGGERGAPVKLVGVAQRRSRHGTLFQTAALLRWRPRDLLDVLDVGPEVREDAARELAGVACGLEEIGADALVGALLARLPAPEASGLP